jgi:hypothetical protein
MIIKLFNIIVIFVYKIHKKYLALPKYSLPHLGTGKESHVIMSVIESVIESGSPIVWEKMRGLCLNIMISVFYELSCVHIWVGIMTHSIQFCK